MEEPTLVIWLFAGIILLIIEIFTPTFFISCFGAGCLVAAATGSIFGSNILLELVVFLISTIVAFILIRPLANKVQTKQHKVKPYIETLVGQKAVVLEQIGPGLSPGRVKIHSENWKARAEDNRLIRIGEEVIIVKVEGVTLFVKPVNQI